MIKRIIEKYMYKCVRCGKLETVANYLDDCLNGSNGYCGCQYFGKDGFVNGIYNEMVKVDMSKIIGERFGELVENYIFVDEANMSFGAKEIRNQIITLCYDELNIKIFEDDEETSEKESKKERETITFTKSASMMLLGLLKVKPVCHFCGCEINKENLGAIYSNPIVAACNNLLCLSELVGEFD